MMTRLFAFAFLLSLLACTPKAGVPVPAETSVSDEGTMRWTAYDEATTLRPGERLGIPKSEVAFSFAQVLSDSRCPEGLDCFRAGEAVILIQLPNGGTQRVDVPAKGRAPIRFNVPGGEVRVNQLAPYPAGQQKIPGADYRLTVTVTRAAAQ